MRVIIKASLTFIGFSHTVVVLGAPLASTTVGLHHCILDSKSKFGKTNIVFSPSCAPWGGLTRRTYNDEDRQLLMLEGPLKQLLCEKSR